MINNRLNLLTLLVIILVQVVVLDTRAQTGNYIEKYRINGITDYEVEQGLVKAISTNALIDSLSIYTSDSLAFIRLKAYELINRKGLKDEATVQVAVVEKLVSGCYDQDLSVINRCLSYLQSYPREAFNPSSKSWLEHLLQSTQTVSFKQLVLLAGYVSFGNEVLQRKLLLKDDYTQRQIWQMHLALARMGNTKSLNYCVDLAQKVKDGNDKVAYILPDLIYTRQKQAIDYCVEILNDDHKHCTSPDPDKDEKICCGYRVMELLAPVIVDFPYELDASGTLNTSDYPSALKESRDWFRTNPDYQINTTTF